MSTSPLRGVTLKNISQKENCTAGVTAGENRQILGDLSNTSRFFGFSSLVDKNLAKEQDNVCKKNLRDLPRLNYKI